MKEPGKVQFINSCCKMSYDRIPHTSDIIFFSLCSHSLSLSVFLSRSFFILAGTCDCFLPLHTFLFTSICVIFFAQFIRQHLLVSEMVVTSWQAEYEWERERISNDRSRVWILFIFNRCVSIKWTISHGKIQGKITFSRQEATFSHILCIDRFAFIGRRQFLRKIYCLTVYHSNLCKRRF